MPTSMTLDYDMNDQRAVAMIKILLASGLFSEHKPTLDSAIADVEAGRVHHYSSLEELKQKFSYV